MVGTIEVFACEMLGKDPVPEAEDALPLLIALGNPHLVHSVHAVTNLLTLQVHDAMPLFSWPRLQSKTYGAVGHHRHARFRAYHGRCRQAVALHDHGDDDRNFRHGKITSDAEVPARAKRHVGPPRPVGLQEPLGTELLPVLAPWRCGMKPID